METCGSFWLNEVEFHLYAIGIVTKNASGPRQKDEGNACWRCGHKVEPGTVCLVCGAVNKNVWSGFCATIGPAIYPKHGGRYQGGHVMSRPRGVANGPTCLEMDVTGEESFQTRKEEAMLARRWLGGIDEGWV
jgi:hypothetical protein